MKWSNDDLEGKVAVRRDKWYEEAGEWIPGGIPQRFYIAARAWCRTHVRSRLETRRVKTKPSLRLRAGIQPRDGERFIRPSPAEPFFIPLGKQGTTDDSPPVEEISYQHAEGLEAVSKASQKVDAGSL
jgi:hypothetical protein